MGIVTKDNYLNLKSNIENLVIKSRKKAYTQINNILVRTYWEIGKYIVEFEQKGEKKATYGENLLGNLSKDLTRKYKKGFSRDNLEKMRKLYLIFSKSETLSRKLSWSHYVLLIRLDNEEARNFYIKEIESENWSVRELDRQINTMLHERLLLSKDKAKVLQLSQKGQIIENPQDLIKDPYVLEFLNLDETSNYNESDLENAIISQIENFLLELGKGFTFVARQKRITLEDVHFYIDLVFYNRLLKCFVIIELKTQKLKHEHLGQLQMYVNYYDREIKTDDENPTIGILLCTDKREAVVKYTLPENNSQIFASKYKLYLPSVEELKQELIKEKAEYELRSKKNE